MFNKLVIIAFITLFVSAGIKADESFFPEWPKKLEEKEIKKKKKVYKKLDALGFIDKLKKAENAFEKIDRDKFNVNKIPYGTATTYKGAKAFVDEAFEEYDKAKKVQKKLAKLDPMLAALQKEYKKSRLKKKSLKFVEELMEANSDLYNSITASKRSVSKWHRKQVKRINKSVKLIKSNFKKNLPKNLEEAEDFIKEVEEAEGEEAKKEAFNTGIKSGNGGGLGRRLSQQIVNLKKYSEELELTDEKDLKKVSDLLGEWGNGGRAVDKKGGKSKAEDELEEFKDAIEDFKKWYDKQDL